MDKQTFLNKMKGKDKEGFTVTEARIICEVLGLSEERGMTLFSEYSDEFQAQLFHSIRAAREFRFPFEIR